ncbi:MAG: O-antigen ligase family protein, partial [Anaerolineales bacterium]|nr:O-antigen ligase family protein [Anaerolineales bacterium]
AIMGALTAPQLATARPLFGRRWPAWAMFALIVATLILTFSRTAMAALLAAIMLVTALRHRKLLSLVALAIVLFMFLPVAQQYSSHFSAGLQGQDLATHMRFGEYRDALTLISRYPLFGVGFGGVPDVDIYLGVSSAYLLLAEQMGLVGLGFFVLAISVVLGWGLHHRRAALSDSTLAAGWLGVHAALIAALVIGLLDHYFVNLEFQAAQMFFWLLVGLALAATRLAQGLK